MSALGLLAVFNSWFTQLPAPPGAQPEDRKGRRVEGQCGCRDPGHAGAGQGGQGHGGCPAG